ncbi:unnamed protein product [Ectocarpus sp. CCAP 1310/34]|nr:unnamed protein product [Ectocarpus sp. CCAP 1310/34]
MMARLRRALPKQLGATAVLLCTLLAQSEGFFAAPNTPTTHSKLASDSNGRTNGHGQFVARSDSGSGGSSAALGAAGSRERLFETVTTLRGGSPAMKIPGYDAAAAAIAAISIPAIAWTGGPALFAQGVLLSMVTSIDGFRIREHFVSYGYGFSVALQAAGAAWLFRDKLHTLSALHAAGLVAYGLRLASFCGWRDTLSCFQNRRKRPTQPKKQNAGPPYTFWGICSMLYAFLALPTVYALRRLPAAEGSYVGVSQAGLAVMAVGLLVESVADLQKSLFKKKSPDTFCSTGLYRFSRHPNYLGEAVFWTGAWLAAIPAYTKWYHWVFSVIGPSQIVSIILRATGGLEKRQVEKYGSSKEWKEYAKSTPVFVPGTRQYSWEKAETKN